MTRAGLLVSLALVLALVGLFFWLRTGLVEDSSLSGVVALDRETTEGQSGEIPLYEDFAASESQASDAGAPIPPESATDMPAFEQDDRMRPRDGIKKVAIVIDDLGRSVRSAQRFLELGYPMSYAVLPFETRTRQVVEALHAADAEVLCHLPMQGLAEANPGPGALVSSMTEEELRSGAIAALDAVVGARGANNHMGSVLSADPSAMRTVLQVIAERGQFFLDSRTSAESVGFAMARSLGLPAAERQVFLDGDPSEAAILGQFERALSIAEERGYAIAIGHPYEMTLEVLATQMPEAASSGFEFVRVSELLEADESTELVEDQSNERLSYSP